MILSRRCRTGNENNQTLEMLIIKIYQESRVIIGKNAYSTELGVVQGGDLSFMLFNLYLEEDLGQSPETQTHGQQGRPPGLCR